MSLRNRTLLLTGASLVALVGIMYVIAVQVFVAGYQRAEQQEIRKRTTEVVRLLEQRLGTFEMLCHDWASWDDSCRFVTDGDSEYIPANLTLSAMNISKANWVAYLDRSERVVYERWYDFDHATSGPTPQDLRPLLRHGSPLLRNPNMHKGQHGLVSSGNGLLIVASRAILTTRGEGPSRGTLVFGRLLGAADLTPIRQATGLGVTVEACSRTHVGSHGSRGFLDLVQPQGIVAQVEGDDAIGGYTMLTDVRGEPAALLRVSDSRQVYQRGRYAVCVMLVPIALLGVALGLLILFMLERLVLSRVARLSTEVLQVATEGDPTSRVSLPGNDELSNLAHHINLSFEALDRSKRQLTEREEQYRALVETTPDWIWQVDEHAVYTYASPKVRDTLGYEPQELLGKTPFDIMPPGEAARVGEAFVAIASRHEPFDRLENTCVHADGRLVVVETSGVPVFDAAGEFRGYRGVDRDITQRREAQLALAAQTERLRVTLRSIGDAVIATDTEGRVSLMSRAAEVLTGWSQSEAVGHPLRDVFRAADPETHEPLPLLVTEALAADGTDLLAEQALLIARDGSEHLIANSSAPIYDHVRQLVGFVFVFRDVTTETRLREEAHRTQRLESLGLLAGGIAHDFNNLLTVILGGVQMAQIVSRDPERLARVLTSAQAACVRAASLTQKLLTFAKGGAPIKQVCALDELVGETIELALAGSAVELDLRVDPWLRLVEADPGQIGQVVQNLIVNAVQAMPHGGTLHVSLESHAPGWAEEGGLATGPEVAIVVRDEGVGIAPGDLPRIFDPYFTTKPEGTGLGLTSAYSIVSQHGGRLTVRSQVGVGSTFTVHLPSAPEDAVPAEAPARRGAAVRGAGHVLIMEDERSVRDVALLFLQEVGYEVEATVRGEDAIAAYTRAQREGHPFDAVILDLTVRGGMGGAETVRRLLQIDPDVRAIVCSGYSDDPVMRQYPEYGFRGCVAKPFEVQELAAAVQQVIAEEPSHPAAPPGPDLWLDRSSA